jgi:ATP-dependent DNA helicase RecG
MRMSDGNFINFTLFDTKENLDKFFDSIRESQGEPILVSGNPLLFGGKVWLNGAVIEPAEFIGKVMPVYKGKPKVIKPESVRQLIIPRLESSFPLAVQHLKSSLGGIDVSKILDLSKLEMILKEAHLPSSMNHAERANIVLDQLAAVISKQKVLTHLKSQNDWKVSARIDVSRWHNVASNIPFQLTGEQVEIINGLAQAVNKAVPLRGLLNGDVGSGKTATYGVIAIQAALEGASVAVLLPNTSLANQIYAELKSWIPADSGLVPHLVTGSSTNQDWSSFPGGKLIIGTTAILFRDLGKMDLVVTDEQQKYSTQQRLALASSETHQLEVTATPIPRTLALAKFGAMQVWRLTKAHTKKDIVTKLFTSRAEGKQILASVNHTISKQNQAVVVYALKEESESELMENVMSATEAYEKWEKRFPTKVRLIHSKMTDEEKAVALGDMKSGAASLLISTTVIEVGVTIPSVMVLVVINAERFGLSTMHQLRGRVARNGNKNGQIAEFLMLTKDNPSPSIVERLSALVRTQSGFEIAEMDAQNRGFGNLAVSSDAQSGADDSIFLGRKIDFTLLEQVI